MNSPTCPVCGKTAKLVSQHAIYGRIYQKGGLVWACQDFPACDTYVGCHPGSSKPLGTMAGYELRQARLAAHNAFDPLWRSGQMSRGQAYAWLSEDLGFRVHLGESTLETATRVRAWALEKSRG